MKVLVVDDEEDILEAVSVGFRFEWPDCTVLTATNGQEALRLFLEQVPDIVVLDVTLPNLNGFEVLREIRRVSDVPVIMVTARQTEANHVRGLDLGADDYVVKPFTILTLLARIRAILRRTDKPSSQSEAGSLMFGEVKVDLHDQQVWVGPNRLQLTPAEFRLLYHLVSNPNRVVSNRVLCERVWGSDWAATANDLKALVHRLRTKLGDNPRQPRYIENLRGIGYRFVGQRQGGRKR